MASKKSSEPTSTPSKTAKPAEKSAAKDKSAPKEKSVPKDKPAAKDKADTKTTVKAVKAPKVTKASKASQVESPAPLAEADIQARIAERAYLIAEARSGAPGDEVADWLQAEREVRALLALD